MKSIALYYKSPNEQNREILSFELHVNLWKVQQQKWLRLSNHFFFDFGIKLPSKVCELYLYLPFRIKNGYVEDLGKRMSESKDLLSAVFNEEMLPEILANNCFTKVKKESDSNNVAFHLYTLSSCKANEESQNLKLETSPDIAGCYIKITIKGTDQLDYNDLYIRFRVEPENIDDILVTSHLSNDLLQAAFSVSDMFDIRVNEKRELHMKVIEKMKAEGMEMCKFGKIHYFYMADVKETVENGSSIKIDSRLLEQEHWDGYEPKQYKTDIRFLAYHWKKVPKDGEQEFPSFSLFYRTTYPSVNVERVFIYIAIAMLISSFGNYLNKTCFLNSPLKIDWILLFVVVCYIVWQNIKISGIGIKRK